MAVYCSLPLDSGGTYKNIMLFAQAPAATAARNPPPTGRGHLPRSYRIPTAWLQKKLAPLQCASRCVADTVAAAAVINRSTAVGMIGSEHQR